MKNQAASLSQLSKDNQETTKQVKEKNFCCSLTKKVKIIIGVIIGALVLAGVGLGVGLHFALKPQIIQEKPAQPVIFSDGSQILISQLILSLKEEIFKPRQNFTVFQTELLSSERRRMLQNEGESNSKFSLTAQFQNSGVTIQMNSQKEIKVVLDPIALTDYLVSRDPEARRLLEEIQNQTQNRNGSEFDQLKIQFQDSMNQEFSSKKAFKLQNQNMVNFVLNQTTKSYEVYTNVTKHRILIQRLLFWRSFRRFFRSIGRFFLKIFGNFQYGIRYNNGGFKPTISGPSPPPHNSPPPLARLLAVSNSSRNLAVTFADAKIRQGVDSQAQTVTNSCITSNLKMSCINSIFTGLEGQGKVYLAGNFTGISQ